MRRPLPQRPGQRAGDVLLGAEREHRLADAGAGRGHPVADQRGRDELVAAREQLLQVDDIGAAQDRQVQRLAGDPVQFLQVRQGHLAQRGLRRQDAQGEHAQSDLVAAGHLLHGADLHEHRQHAVGGGLRQSAVARDLGEGQDAAPVAERAQHVERLPQHGRRGPSRRRFAHRPSLFRARLFR